MNEAYLLLLNPLQLARLFLVHDCQRTS